MPVKDEVDIIGVGLFGGLGTRIDPASRSTNKHLNPVGVSIPMAVFPLLTLQNAGINKVCLITGGGHSGHFSQLLGEGQLRYLPTKEEKENNITPPAIVDLSVMFKVQDKPGGISEAILLAENFVGDNPFVVILGDNILIGDISPHIQGFRENPDKARILLYQVDHPEHYGIAVIDESGDLAEIIEKPTPEKGYDTPPSNFAVIGVYMYPPDAFDKIRSLKRSERGELEVTDLNQMYLEEGRLEWGIFEGTWIDAGEHQWSLVEAGIMLAENWDVVIAHYPTLCRIAPPPQDLLDMIKTYRRSS